MRTQFTKAFLEGLLLLTGLAGAYWGAVALDARRQFWIVLAIALAYALLRTVLPIVWRRFQEVKRLLQRGRQYGHLMNVAGTWQSKAEDFEESLAKAREEAQEKFYEGTLQGRSRAVGEFLAAQSGTIVIPIAMTLEDDSIAVIVEYTPHAPPPVGSLWMAKVKGSAPIRAVLVVRDIDAIHNRATLEVDHVRDPSFGRKLLSHAESSTDFPNSVELVAREISTIEDLLEEG